MSISVYQAVSYCTVVKQDQDDDDDENHFLYCWFTTYDELLLLR